MASKNPPIRVVVADDHPVYRKGLTDALTSSRGVEIVGQAATGRAALELIRELKPDVAVIDMKMPECDGMQVMRTVSSEHLPSRILFISGYLGSTTVYGAIEAGAQGYISKDSEPEAICDAVLAVARGQTVLGPETHDAIGDEIRQRAPAASAHLSHREREILSHTAEGETALEIADRLHLSPATVKTHIQRIYQKLGVSDRAAAVAAAMRMGILE